MKNKKFATCINCIDGRTQEPVTTFLKRRLRVDFIDMITEPGPDKILAENKDRRLIASIKRRARISLEQHHSNTIVIVGHADCVGNPVNKAQHLHHIRKSIHAIRCWGVEASIFGLWVTRCLQVEKIP